MKAVFLVLLFLLTAAVYGQLTITNGDKEAILMAHNSYRSSVNPVATNMLELVWSDELAEVARNYSAKCMFTFNPDRVSQQDIFNTVGENLSFDFSDGTFDYVALINNWGVQGDDYNIEDNTCQGVCAFYTQMIWANTGFVGCSASRCIGGFLFVCNYGPGGNFLGQLPYIAGNQSCIACPAGATRCTNNLCSSRPASDNVVSTPSILILIMTLLCVVAIKLVI